MTREEAKGNLIHAIRWNDMPKKEALEIAIKALELEPCEDAISRVEALKIATTEYELKKIRELPSVNPTKTGHWIPVSEELPDKEGYYLCSVRYMYPPYNFFEPEKVKYMDDVTIQKFDGEFNIEVKAWMPLPAPFEPQEGSDKE